MKSKKIYGVLGYPVKHSFSPAMHNAAFGALRMNAEYRYFEKKPEDLANFISALAKEGISGLNVTVPHKEKVIPLLSEIAPEARLIGAVNTIKVEEDSLLGFNTDGAGFLRHLTEGLNFDPQGKTICLIGAGGAARAVAVYLSKAEAKEIAIFDLDGAKADILLKHLRDNFPEVEYRAAHSIEALNIPLSGLLINATPAGMKAADPSPVDIGLLHKDLLVYDLIYNPQETRLLQLADKNGAQTANGLGMLLYQGMLSFEIWTGQKAPLEVMRRALKEVAYQ